MSTTVTPEQYAPMLELAGPVVRGTIIVTRGLFVDDEHSTLDQQMVEFSDFVANAAGHRQFMVVDTQAGGDVRCLNPDDLKALLRPVVAELMAEAEVSPE